MTSLPWQRCYACEREYQTADARSMLCQRCDANAQAAYRALYAGPHVDLEPAPWTKAAMRERLGVTGDVDE